MSSPLAILDPVFRPINQGAGFLDNALMDHPLLTLIILVYLGATVVFLLLRKDKYPQAIGWQEFTGWRKYLFKWPLALGLGFLGTVGTLTLSFALIFHGIAAVAGGYSYPSQVTVKEVRPQEGKVALTMPGIITKVWCPLSKTVPPPKVGEKASTSAYSSCLQPWLRHRASPTIHQLPLEGATYEVYSVASGRDHEGHPRTFALVEDPMTPLLTSSQEDATTLVFTVKEGTPPLKEGALLPATLLAYPNNSEHDALYLGTNNSLAAAVAGEKAKE